MVAEGTIVGTLLYVGADKLVNWLTRFDSQGFDKNGFDRDGYNRFGYNSDGYNRNGYDAEGFDKNGFNEQGFDCHGFDRQGYTADGYNRDGRDRLGFNRAGFDIEGFNRYGQDAEGYFRNGFDRNGYNREGFDHQGYGRDFYSPAGFDRAGRTATQYVDLIGQLYLRLRDAQHQLDIGDFRYAVNDARTVMEETLRLVVEHARGIESSGDCLLENLKICENRSLLPVDPIFIDRLHGVRHICNEVIHQLDASDRLSHQKTFFVVMQTRDLLKSAEKTLCCA